MGLLDDLRSLSDQIRRRIENVRGRGEEAAKQALILPFLQVLGWDIYDPTEVQPEYVADFAQKKAGQREKVDYALHLNGLPAIFIEAKAVDVNFEAHDAQLARYFNATPTVKTGILTNGVKYRFFTDLHEPNIMSDTSFFEFDIMNFNEHDVETLRRFTKDGYDPSEVRAAAEDLIYVGKLTSLVGELLRNPSENFIRFLLNEVDLTGGKRLTSRVIERFWPVVRKAIQTNLLEMATRSIRLETQTEPKTLPSAPVVAAPVAASVVASNEGKIVTTQEELDAFEQVKVFCASSSFVAKYPVTWKDSQSYFTVHIQGSIRSWFLRFFLDAKRKSISTRLSVEAVRALAPGFEVEAAPSSLGVSRLYLSNLTELARLGPLVFAAYEDAAKRRDSGAEESDPA